MNEEHRTEETTNAFFNSLDEGKLLRRAFDVFWNTALLQQILPAEPNPFNSDDWATSPDNFCSPTAIPSNYVHWLQEISRDRPMISMSRISARSQIKSLSAQQWDNRRRVEKLGFSILQEFGEVSSGWVFRKSERPILVDAVKLAKKHDATLVYANIDRLLRNRNYRDNNDKMPTEHDFEQYMELLDGVSVATIAHPNTPRKGKNGMRSQEIQWGQNYSGNFGGRPRKREPGYMKRRREEKRLEVLLLFQRGFSLRKIESQTGIARQTASAWIKKHGSD